MMIMGMPYMFLLAIFGFFRAKTAKNSQKFVFSYLFRKTGIIPPKIDRNIKTEKNENKYTTYVLFYNILAF